MLQQILRLNGHLQNIYLAVYPDKLLLLDGCCRADVPFVLATIRNLLGRDVRQLKAVIVTHMHADHAGGANYLKQATGCQIISANRSKQWYAGVEGRVNYLLDLSLSYFVAYRHGSSFKNLNYPRELFADICLNDGDVVPMFEDWQILETIGHTDRDLSVYHQATGKIYVADLIIKLRNQRFVNPYNVHNPQAYVQSLQKIKKLQPKLVLMAHGGQAFIDDKTFDKLIKKAPKIVRTNLDVYKDIVFRVVTRKVPRRRK